MATQASRTTVAAQVVDFAQGLRWSDVPAHVRRHLALALIDFAAVSTAGRVAPASLIAADHASENHGGSAAVALLDGRPLSVTGAAWANGVLGNVQAVDATATEAMEALLVGYEIAIHAGVMIHEREAQYHASASWGSLGVAAAACRLLGVDAEAYGHALGIAEYHAPIALMPRAVGDPAMTKDTCGWGAMNGTNSALLAARGFTGLTSEFMLADRRLGLGDAWGLLDLYIKPYPCCRWSQGAIDAARAIAPEPIAPDDVERVVVRTFAAADLLSRRRPTNTEEMQYSLTWPVATTLARGAFGVPEVLAGFDDPDVHRLEERIEVVVDDDLTAAFPARRITEVEIHLVGGGTRASGPVEAAGEPGTAGWEGVILGKAALHLRPDGARCADAPTLPDTRLGALDAAGLIDLITYGLEPVNSR